MVRTWLRWSHLKWPKALVVTAAGESGFSFSDGVSALAHITLIPSSMCPNSEKWSQTQKLKDESMPWLLSNCQLRSKPTFSQDKEDFVFAYCKLFLGSWGLKITIVLVSTKRKSRKFGLLCVQLNKNYDLSSYYFTIFLASLKIINFI